MCQTSCFGIFFQFDKGGDKRFHQSLFSGLKCLLSSRSSKEFLVFQSGLNKSKGPGVVIEFSRINIGHLQKDTELIGGVDFDIGVFDSLCFPEIIDGTAEIFQLKFGFGRGREQIYSG